MIAVGLTVPFACWRKSAAREFLETEELPPPATCYGAFLSFVGETQRERHVGARVTAGLVNHPAKSTVLRTLWRVKKKGVPPGNGSNARPDYQQLVINASLVLWCDSSDEPTGRSTLEERVREAFAHPTTVERFGGWSLGESTHLINDAWLYDNGTAPHAAKAFLLRAQGHITLPVWVDHVGSTHTRFVTGDFVPIAAGTIPQVTQLPSIRSEVGSRI